MAYRMLFLPDSLGRMHLSRFPAGLPCSAHLSGRMRLILRQGRTMTQLMPRKEPLCSLIAGLSSGAVPLAYHPEHLRHEQQQAGGCPDVEAPCDWVDGQLRQTSLRRSTSAASGEKSFLA